MPPRAEPTVGKEKIFRPPNATVTATYVLEQTHDHLGQEHEGDWAAEARLAARSLLVRLERVHAHVEECLARVAQLAGERPVHGCMEVFSEITRSETRMRQYSVSLNLGPW